MDENVKVIFEGIKNALGEVAPLLQIVQSNRQLMSSQRSHRRKMRKSSGMKVL